MGIRNLDRRQVLGIAAGAVLGGAGITIGQERRSRLSWLADVQRPPAELPPDSPKLKPLLEAGDEPITDLAGWQRRRQELRHWWSQFLGVLPRPSAPPELRLIEEERLDGVVRQRVTYESLPGWPTEAYLLRPAVFESPRPAVAVFHSTVAHSIRQPAGVEGAAEKAFGLALARRGYVAFCPRNFLWPDNQSIEGEAQTRRFHEQLPESKGMAMMLHEAMLAVDILASLPEVDARRIGAIGHSLGAKEVLYLAAFDERVQVTVSSEGGIGTEFSNWDAPWYLGPSINESDFAHEHHELLGLVAPRAFLLIGGDSADGNRSWPFIEAALPVYRLFSNSAAESGGLPRIGLLNHGQGHSVPPDAERTIYEWFDALL
jgi:dienelactone hydrolase